MKIKFSKKIPPYSDEGHPKIARWYSKGKWKRMLGKRWMKKRVMEMDESMEWFV